ncbi:hypothetical protein C8J57DRAFT_1503148 [Mycena rebaudengoi]|nr:hypothetical protein C8J57DRAFT_1503148 [Mycena rebaudengoi]
MDRQLHRPAKYGHKPERRTWTYSVLYLFRTPQNPVMDNAYEMELADAIKEGLVEPTEDIGSEGLPYIWEGVVFAMDEH